MACITTQDDLKCLSEAMRVQAKKVDDCPFTVSDYLAFLIFQSKFPSMEIVLPLSSVDFLHMAQPTIMVDSICQLCLKW